ncbi:hypothetical protein OCU04_000780 [Sclerotinia nivalis]|uniref:Uncharacterized protein n=1 Tax=Sclerotinia nivalis TaxID=352851 RepID=A0A9X0AWT1_9HELO|nr:hypothetical protein OCU04_000780 [Sclerotinia nivalis]
MTRAPLPQLGGQPPLARMHATPSTKRHSLSPSPVTPRSTFQRRPSSGLRGRKSTSSSVSSISLPTRSPHHSVKVLPATPTLGSFPSNIRVVRQTPLSSFNEGVSWGGSNSAFGAPLVFAKRKKNLFKGPALNTSSPIASSSGHGHGHARTGSHSRSASIAGRRSGEIIEEEDEEEIEEVDVFTPVVGPAETEEMVFTPGDMLRLDDTIEESDREKTPTNGAV